MSASIEPSKPVIDEEAQIENEIMCSCSGTTRGQIIHLVLDGLDLDAISRRTGALSGCGGCDWDVGEFVKQLQTHLNP